MFSAVLGFWCSACGLVVLMFSVDLVNLCDFRCFVLLLFCLFCLWNCGCFVLCGVGIIPKSSFCVFSLFWCFGVLC